MAKCRVILNPVLDEIEGVNDGGVITAELLANAREGAGRYLTAEIHRDLATEGDALRTPLRFKLCQTNMKAIRHELLNDFDIGFFIIAGNQIS